MKLRLMRELHVGQKFAGVVISYGCLKLNLIPELR
jgi:hypothetical protein